MAIEVGTSQAKFSAALSTIINKKFKKSFELFERNLVKQFRINLVKFAPDGDRSRTGKKLIDILAGLKSRTEGSRQGIRRVVDKKLNTVFLTLQVNDSDEAKLIKWVNDGTGIFGPEGQTLKAEELTSGGLFVWEDESGQKIFARETEGQEAQHFIEAAAKETLSSLGRIRFG